MEEKNYPQQERTGFDEYRQQVSAIYDYEAANNIPENDCMTKWYDEMNIAVAKPWYKENDPSAMDRTTRESRVPISEASIAARYAEISREQKERNSSDVKEEPLVEISNLEYKEKRLFVDMDGTLAKYQQVDTLELLFEEGYFKNLEPQQNVVEAVRKIVMENPETEVYIMSSVLSDSKYALQEKNEWLDRYLPEIDKKHRIFPPCGDNKLNYVPGGVRTTDYLLDDYTNNLALWEPPAKGIKLLNGINHTNETWKGSLLRYDKEPEKLADDILKVVSGTEIREERPEQQKINLANQEYDRKIKNGYISQEERWKLNYLNREQAAQALCDGVHICRVNEFPEYHGSHADEYSIMELKTEQELKNLYSTWGTGVEHKACISPYYDKPGELKKILQEKTAAQQETAHKTTIPKQNTPSL